MKYPIQYLIIPIALFCYSVASVQAEEGIVSDEYFCSSAEKIARERTPEVFNKLTEMYKNNSEQKRLKCIAEYLAQSNPDATTNFFINTLQDKDLDTRARAAYGLGIVKDKRAIDPLHKVFQDPDSGIRCNVAYALGSIKAPSSLPLLIPKLDSEFPNIRRCIIKALRSYNDPRSCQKLYDMWMNDSDQAVEIEAGLAVSLGGCESVIKRSTEYIVADEYCKIAQDFVNKTAEAISKYPRKNEWSKNIDYLIKPNEINFDTPDEESTMKVAFLMASGDWGESVDHFYGLKDWGSLEENRKHYIIEINDYQRKEEGIKLYCPNIKFPGFSYWNEILQRNSK